MNDFLWWFYFRWKSNTTTHDSTQRISDCIRELSRNRAQCHTSEFILKSNIAHTFVWSPCIENRAENILNFRWISDSIPDRKAKIFTNVSGWPIYISIYNDFLCCCSIIFFLFNSKSTQLQLFQLYNSSDSPSERRSTTPALGARTSELQTSRW